MKLLLKTQILSIIIAIFWIVYLNVLALFDQPGPILQYLNWFVYGFALLLTIIYVLIDKIHNRSQVARYSFGDNTVSHFLSTDSGKNPVKSSQ